MGLPVTLVLLGKDKTANFFQAERDSATFHIISYRVQQIEALLQDAQGFIVAVCPNVRGTHRV